MGEIVSDHPGPGLLVDTLNATFGGAHRTAHSIGIGLVGAFTPASDAHAFSRAAIFAGAPTPVTARFSNGAGGPSTDDRRPDVRGLAVKFHLPSDIEFDMIAVSMPFFFVKTPEEFLEFLRLTIPQPASGLVDPQALTGWFSTHPNAYNAFVLLNEIGVDESYGGLAYNSLHAFHYANADGKTSVARFAWIPDQPTPRRPHNSDTSAWQPDYLRREIVSRVTAGCGPGFTLVATLQGPGDEEDNSSQTWNSTETRTLGRLQLGALVRDQYWDCEALRFNPARLIDGIDLSSDPILLARKDAYDVSADRRTAAYPPRD